VPGAPTSPPPLGPPPRSCSHLWDTLTFTLEQRNGSAPQAGGAAAAVPLPPEVAALPYLSTLAMGQRVLPIQGGVPAQWLTPGAFPALKMRVWGVA
jgi:hypothetical protein